MADNEYLMDLAYEDKKKAYEQILNTDLKDIEDSIVLFEKMNEEDNICVVGNKEAIDKCKDRFISIFDYNDIK